MDHEPIYASPSRPHARVHWRRGYVLVGVEVDRDVDATDAAIHLWPVTVELTLPPKRR